MKRLHGRDLRRLELQLGLLTAIGLAIGLATGLGSQQRAARAGGDPMCECVAGQPRVMILLDASSSKLNINAGSQAGGMGETGWDQIRDSLAGVTSMFVPT